MRETVGAVLLDPPGPWPSAPELYGFLGRPLGRALPLRPRKHIGPPKRAEGDGERPRTVFNRLR